MPFPFLSISTICCFYCFCVDIVLSVKFTYVKLYIVASVLKMQRYIIVCGTSVIPMC
ncbi:spore germination protein [Prevotella pallens ATCC 700821]|uniref:Spore germination protein n=1 Tax=Prevotella pallens ATCC 700821 TaxID=997353 RepID=F9DJJ9_9BACT|nr:spore germination protein [Prevotella pallens ATCC 700821]